MTSVISFDTDYKMSFETETKVVMKKKLHTCFVWIHKVN